MDTNAIIRPRGWIFRLQRYRRRGIRSLVCRRSYGGIRTLCPRILYTLHSRRFHHLEIHYRHNHLAWPLVPRVRRQLDNPLGIPRSLVVLRLLRLYLVSMKYQALTPVVTHRNMHQIQQPHLHSPHLGKNTSTVRDSRQHQSTSTTGFHQDNHMHPHLEARPLKNPQCPLTPTHTAGQSTKVPRVERGNRRVLISQLRFPPLVHDTAHQLVVEDPAVQAIGANKAISP